MELASLTVAANVLTVITASFLPRPEKISPIKMQISAVDGYSQEYFFSEVDKNSVSTQIYRTFKKEEIDMPEYLEENLDTLRSFLELSDNWDGEGAKGFSVNFINGVCDVIRRLDLQPEIFPLQNGDVQLEYGNVRNKYLEFAISNSGTMKIYKRVPGKASETRDNVAFNLENIQKEVEWFGS